MFCDSSRLYSPVYVEAENGIILATLPLFDVRVLQQPAAFVQPSLDCSADGTRAAVCRCVAYLVDVVGTLIVAEKLTAVQAMRDRTVQVEADPKLGVIIGDDGGKAPQQLGVDQIR